MKRKEITVQASFHERITLSRKRAADPFEDRCEACGRAVRWLPVIAMITEFDLDADELMAAVEGGTLHLRLDRHGTLFTCEGSAVSRFRAREIETKVKRKEA